MQRFALVALLAAFVATEAEAKRGGRKWGKGKGGKGKHTEKKLENGSLSSCMIGDKGSDDIWGKVNFYQSDDEGADTSARASFWNLQTEETVEEVTTPAGVYTIDIRSGVTVADTDAGATNDECGAGTVTETLVSDFAAKDSWRNKWGRGSWTNKESGLTLADESVTGNWAVITLNGDTPVVQGCCQITAVDDGSDRRLSDILQ